MTLKSPPFAALIVVASSLSVSCQMETDGDVDTDVSLVQEGEKIFFNETFDGNGRTCGTCHRSEDNFGLSPRFIAQLPSDDPLFVAETRPSLSENFENPRLMREVGLILENQDGFDDLDGNFNMRGIPHTLALSTSVDSADGPRTGWSGDGAPGDGSLRSFSVGAVIQHFPKSTRRIAGVDFRMPTAKELDALEAFMLSLGRQEDLELPLELKGIVAARGQEIFLDNSLGKCNICHFNAGANVDPNVFGTNLGNRNFNTGVENLPDAPAKLSGEQVPSDDGFGIPGDGEFNTPPLVESADTGPFFHDNSIDTIEGAVAFYNGASFNLSPAGRALTSLTGGGIELEATQTVAVAAFLRVINALENVRMGIGLLRDALSDIPRRSSTGNSQLERANHEILDAIEVLSAGGLHPLALEHMSEARRVIDAARDSRDTKAFRARVRKAIVLLRQGRAELVNDTHGPDELKRSQS